MGHVAVVGYGGFGHVKPTLGVVEELVGRGHRVSYLIADPYADAVRAAGATAVPYRSLIPGLTIGESEMDDETMALGLVHEAWAPAAPAMRHFSADPPDVVLHDSVTSVTAKLLSTSFGTDRLTNHTMFATDNDILFSRPEAKEMLVNVDVLAREFVDLYGRIYTELAPWSVDSLMDIAATGPRPSANLVYLPRAFQTWAETLDETYRFVGPCLRPAELHPSWTPPERDTVLVSLGTSPSAHRAGFLRTCVRAAAGQPWQLVIVLGNRNQVDLGALPANVRVHAWLPHTAVLPHAKAFITHGGMGSLMEAFSFGVPVLVAPDTKEQMANVARVDDLGLGWPLSRQDTTVEQLRALLADLMTDRTVSRRLAAMCAELDACGGAAEAADIVENLARPARMAS